MIRIIEAEKTLFKIDRTLLFKNYPFLQKFPPLFPPTSKGIVFSQLSLSVNHPMTRNLWIPVGVKGPTNNTGIS
jgi:hypothetical protein